MLLNLIKVRNSENYIIDKDEYYLRLNNANKQYDNPITTFKVMLYLCSLITECGLCENTFTITKTDILHKLSISDVRHFEYSLIYLSSISFDYKVHSSWYSCNILASYKHFKGYFKVVFSDEFISLLDRTKQFYQVPNEVLNSDIRYYRHSVFIANYILLHKRRNKGKKTENVISVKELIKNCPLLPLYDELDKKQRQVQRSIIKPFDTNLKNACMFLGLNYKYDNPPKNYIDFTRSKIIFS